jgi:hypothetical protein
LPHQTIRYHALPHLPHLTTLHQSAPELSGTHLPNLT